MRTPHRLRIFSVLSLIVLLILSACADEEHSPDDGHNHDKIHVSAAWVKAAESGMTAAFGVLHNDTGSEITITSISSPASTEVQLHETVTTADHNSTMQEVKTGFVIGGGQNLELEPGGNHIMLMDLTAPLLPGQEVTFTIHFSDGTSQDITAVVKEFDGAEESYENHGQTDQDHAAH